MECRSHKQLGQGLIEALLGMSLIILLIAVITGVALHLKGAFKHDYLQKTNSAEIEFPGSDFLDGKLISLEHGSPSHNLQLLEQDGWQVSGKLKLEDQLFYLMTNRNQKMLFTGRIGVKICSNCSRD
jgi:hypothetical protein